VKSAAIRFPLWNCDDAKTAAPPVGVVPKSPIFRPFMP
jgi:hypothetical protein